MSKNIKIGNKTYNGVKYISCACADEEGVQRKFIDEDEKSKPIEISTSEEMNALLIAANIGKCYRYVGDTDSEYINGDIYIVEESN